MTAPLELDRVWQPIQIGPMTLKNRIIVPAREARWSRLDRVDPAHAKRILVVGGGPSGLKLASVAARRGHEVTLVEDELPDLGDRVARIGDALAPRKLAELIYEGELIGRGV